MLCPRCGKENPENEKKCANCGAELTGFSQSYSGTVVTPSGSIPDMGATRISSGETLVNQVSQPQGNMDKTLPSGDPIPIITDEEAELRKALSHRYEIIKKLGAGGMATVYLAREIALDRKVAIKVLPRAYVRDPDFVARFKREAQVAANLEHPHIVSIYQISEEDGLVYFVMSFIPGGSVTDRIKKNGTVPVDDIAKWIMDVCSALAYGHEHGVIHRDLKPDNIMLDKNDRAVVMDYGIAKAGEGSGLTQTGTIIGTPQYMSPEQARGKTLDARSDIYSLGIVLYQMATGELPFQATDAASLMYMHVHETPAPPDVVNAKIPSWLRDIILKCLAKNPEDRFANVTELKNALAEKYAPKLKTTPMKDKARRKKMNGLTAAAVIVLLALAGGAAYYYLSYLPSQKTSREQAVNDRQPGTQAPGQQANDEQKDDKAFGQAQSVNSKESYNTYLMMYPEGRHIDEAKAKIAELTAQDGAKPTGTVAVQDLGAAAERQRLAAEAKLKAEEDARNRQDDSSYQNAEMVNTKQSYGTYLKNYPNGRHTADAMKKLSALDETEAARIKAEAEETAKKDNQAFQLASSENTKQAYNAYLISYPNGAHASDARSKISAIEAEEGMKEKIRTALSALSIRMVAVKPGSFIMGADKGGADEKPVRTVKVDGFGMSATEITQAQWKAVMGGNPSYFKLDDNCPVEKISWKDAITFCNKLSDKMGLDPCYDLSSGTCNFAKNGFRLPTEAEWEYACRAESGLEYNLGDGESALNRAGWYNLNSQEKTHPAGQKTPNAFGFYDMHGNVWEWCNDWYDKAAYSSGETVNPSGPKSGSDKVLRGGGWLDNPKDCRSAKRRNFGRDKSYSDIGFRIVRG